MPMRLALLVEAPAAGVGRHVIDLGETLSSLGHEVHLIYSDLRADQVFRDDLDRLSRLPRVHASQIPMRREVSASDLTAVRSLRRYLNTHGPFDLIHSHSTKAGLVGRLGAVGRPMKRVYTPHMFFTMQLARNAGLRRAVGMLETGLSRLCDGVIVVSHEEYAHALTELKIAPGKLRLIPNGVAGHQDPAPRERAELRRAWGIREKEVCVGFAGRLVAQKSPQTMLESFAALLRRAVQPVKLVMVGDGPLAPEVRQMAAKLRIERDVVFLGARNARPLMQGFDIFALTSDCEGHALVVLEAMACGLPVVATAVGGIADTVRPGANGFIAPVRGVAEIARSLEALVGNPALRARMGNASRTLARNFSVRRMAERTLAFYEEVISAARGANISPDFELTSGFPPCHGHTTAPHSPSRY